MKKFLSGILCAAMLVQAIIVFADAGGSSESNDIADSVYVLNKLGIVETTADTDFEKEVTRAEFAAYLNNILRNSADNDELFFVDVPPTYWAAESINALVPSGIISYAADGKFNPEELVTYEQMCKMLVCTLGYGGQADTGAYGMNAYVKIAERMDFGISVKNREASTLRDVISIIYRAMQAPLPDVIVKSDKTLKLNQDREATLFSVYFNTYIGEGMINAYYGESLSDYTAAEGEALIDNTRVAVDPDFVLRDMLGEYCDIVYTKKDDEITLIYAAPIEDEPVIIESDDMISFEKSSNTLKYYEGDKEKKMSFSKSADIVFNGRLYMGDASDKLAELISGSRIGKIKYIKPAAQGAKEVLLITSYEVYIANRYDTAEQALYEYYDNSNVINLTEYENTFVKNSNGELISMPEVFPIPMLIGASEDKKNLNIIVCSRTEDIAVSILSDESCSITTADGRERRVFESVYPKLKLSAGKSYRVTYDIFGNIVFASEKSQDGDMSIGYLRFIKETDTGLEKKYHISLYAQDKAFHNYPMATKVLIDGYTYKSEDVKEWLLKIPGNTSVIGDRITVERQIIRYELNADGEIKKIDTYNCTDKEDPDSTLTRIADRSQSLCWDNTRSSFGMNVYVTGDHTKQLSVPVVDENGRVSINGELVSESADMYGDTLAVRDWYYYNIEAYKYDPDMLQAEVVVLYAEPVKEKTDFIMFENTSEALNGDGDVLTVINGISNGAEISMPVSDGCLEVVRALNEGDIVHVDTDFTGSTAYRVTKAFDAKTRAFEPYGAFTSRERFWYATDETVDINDPGRWRNATRQMTKSYAYDRKNVAISSSYTLGDAKMGIVQQVTRCQGLGVGIYDSNAPKDKVYAAATTDINTYKATGENCDMILICSSNPVVKQIFVYR